MRWRVLSRPAVPTHPPRDERGCAVRKATLMRFAALVALVGSVLSGAGRINGWPWP